MCFICDGGTHEQSRRFIELAIIYYGWAVRGVHPVDDEPDGGHWSHTIGLLESFGHPELVITDVEYELAGQLLNDLGEDIRAGVDITEHGDFRFREVHPDHLDTDLLAAYWENYGHAPAPGQVWQVVLPDYRFCPEHAGGGTDLTDPNQFPGA